MSLSDGQIQSLMERSKQRERKARRAALAISLIPVVFAVLFLAITLWNINLVQQQLIAKQNALKNADAALQDTTRTLQSVNSQLADSNQKMSTVQALLATREVDISRKADQLKQADGQLKENQITLSTMQAELNAKKNEYNELESQVNLARKFKTVRDYYQWQIWLKENINSFYRIYANDRVASKQGEDLLLTLDKLFSKSPNFNGTGTTEDQGFTSPSFAAYVLQKIGRIPPPTFPILMQSDLRAYLLANGIQIRSGGSPKAGDLILYKDGFCMFYFPDEQQGPFVIGMTVSSVKVFSPDFTDRNDVIAVLP